MRKAFVPALISEIRRRVFTQPSRAQKLELSVEKTVSLGQKGMAAMLNVNGELLLLGVTTSAVTLLHRWEASSITLPVKGTVR